MPKIQIPFVTIANNRSYTNTKDAISQNIYIEKGDKDYIVKRPGASLLASFTGTVGVPRGWFYCKPHNVYYAVVGNIIYKINPTTWVFTDLSTPFSAPLTGTGTVFFEQTQQGNTTVVVIHNPGSTGQLVCAFKSGAVIYLQSVTSSWINTNTVGAVISIDSSIYTMSLTDSITTIQGSNISAPLQFTALNVINASLYPDAGITLAKYRNQLVCFKEKSTEFFYNAGNPVGSQLSPIPEQAFQIGCAVATSVVNMDDNIVWMSRDQNGGLGFHMMGGGGIQKISTTYIDRILASVESIVNTGIVQASYMSFEGHKFYIINIDGVVPSSMAIPGVAIPGQAIPGVTSGGAITLFTRTLVYDLSTQQWAEWTSTDNTGSQVSYFAAYCISGASISTSKNYTNSLVLNKANGDIYMISPPPLGNIESTVYQDINYIEVKIRTNKLDGNTRNRKKMTLLEVTGDMDTQTNNLNISYSDDDYQTWSAQRTVDLSKRSFLTNQGMFRNRAYEFSHIDNRPLRLSHFEVNVELMDH